MREETRLEALYRLHETYDREVLPKAWYIFEGMSCPDLYIEGEDHIILCEGKWTEPHITEKTTHLGAPHEFRNQMIRHIQGAMQISAKKLIAFYIVDENCRYTDLLDRNALKKQMEKETIPLSSDEQNAILSCFYGYTTWQALQKRIPEISFPEKQHIDSL